MNGGSVSQGWPGMTHDSVSDGSLSQRLAPLQRGTNPSQIETLQFTSRGLHHHPPDTGAKVWRTFIFGSWNRKRERLRSFSKLSIFGLYINGSTSCAEIANNISHPVYFHSPRLKGKINCQFFHWNASRIHTENDFEKGNIDIVWQELGEMPFISASLVIILHWFRYIYLL